MSSKIANNNNSSAFHLEYKFIHLNLHDKTNNYNFI